MTLQHVVDAYGDGWPDWRGGFIFRHVWRLFRQREMTSTEVDLSAVPLSMVSNVVESHAGATDEFAPILRTMGEDIKREKREGRPLDGDADPLAARIARFSITWDDRPLLGHASKISACQRRVHKAVDDVIRRLDPEYFAVYDLIET